MYQVVTTFTLGGDVADFAAPMQESCKATLADAAGVALSDVQLALAPGSVRCEATILVPTEDSARAVAKTLADGIMATPGALEAALRDGLARDGVAQATRIHVEEITEAPAPKGTDGAWQQTPVLLGLSATAVSIPALAVSFVLCRAWRLKSTTRHKERQRACDEDTREYSTRSTSTTSGSSGSPIIDGGHASSQWASSPSVV